MIEKIPGDSVRYKEYMDDIMGYHSGEEKKKDIIPISQRISEIRKTKGISVEELAAMTGIDKNLLTRIENQEVYPDLGTVVRLSKGLRIATSMLWGDESSYSYSIVRKEDRQNIKRYVTGTREKIGYEYQSLVIGVKERHMESFMVTLEGDDDNVDLSGHEGEEFILVLEGNVMVKLGDKEEILYPGDTLYFHSSIPHYLMTAVKGKSAQILAVIYTGN